MGAHRDWPPLTLRPRVSRRLAILVVTTHGLALLAVAALPLSVYSLLLLLLILASAVHAVYVSVLMRAPWSVRSACWQSDGSWTIRLGSGEERLVTLSPATFVSQPLVALNFSDGHWRRHALPLFSDALDAETLRRLRQRLRIQGIGAAADTRPDGDKGTALG